MSEFNRMTMKEIADSIKNSDSGKQLFDKASEDPKLSHALNKLLEWEFTRMDHAKNASKILHVERTIDLVELRQYLHKPTARKYFTAIVLFQDAKEMIERFTKDDVKSSDDCDFLKTIFHTYAKAYMCENSLYKRFQPTSNQSHLVDLYLKWRPYDHVAQYFRVIQIFKRNAFKGKTEKRQAREFELLKENIVEGEKFLHEISKRKCEFPEKNEIMTDVYYRLASTYSITCQRFRARDAFEKCYSIDQANYSALFGVAHHYMDIDNEKAVALFQKYLSLAPDCDKQYPDAYYTLSHMYFNQFKNKSEAVKYYYKGVETEAKRLPFLGPCNCPEKQEMQLIIELEK